MTTGYKSKTTVAAEAIRQKILDGTVARGERMDVRILATELGMSITPVREALRILQSEGLVSYDEHRAISAMTLSAEDAHELYVFRAMVEGFTTELAARRWTPEDSARSLALHEDMARAVEAGDVAAASLANRAWHFAIYRAATTRFIEPVITRLWDQFAWNTIWSVPNRLHHSVAEHARILDAVESGDCELAGRLMREHINGGAEAVRLHGAASANGDGDGDGDGTGR